MPTSPQTAGSNALLKVEGWVGLEEIQGLKVLTTASLYNPRWRSRPLTSRSRPQPRRWDPHPNTPALPPLPTPRPRPGRRDPEAPDSGPAVRTAARPTTGTHRHRRHPPRRPGSSPLGVLCLQQSQVGLPLVADDLPASEAADRDNHGADWQDAPRCRRSCPGCVHLAGPGSAPIPAWPVSPGPDTAPTPLSSGPCRDESTLRRPAAPGARPSAAGAQDPPPGPSRWYVSVLRRPSTA